MDQFLTGKELKMCFEIELDRVSNIIFKILLFEKTLEENIKIEI